MSSTAAAITTSTAAALDLPDNTVDYIFTDPPFGENIYYADLNFLVEAWHRVFTNAIPEAIVDRFKKKGLPEYQHLMQRCFTEYYRVLKPGRWMTVVFHNSRNAVWNAIQEAMLAAGFVVADVRTMDKQQGSYRQVTSTAVKQDLVISAYKPNEGLEERFKIEAGTEESVWDFIRAHLKQLPVFVSKDGQAEVVSERQNYLLFDRMVAFHVLRGETVPLSAAEFYEGLVRRFPERDGMYFLPEQAIEYDKKRMTVREILQLEFFVIDESSAIQWLKQQLIKKPQTFQELHPQFLREIGGWQKHERPLELSEMLEQNFLCFDGKGDVPSQIHSYLSTNFKELRNLPKDDPTLRSKAKDRWYVPDPNKASDLEKWRERALLREFEKYRESKQKRLKVFRLEAVRAGFRKYWQERTDEAYKVIIEVARKIPENLLQEDQQLLMWYDVAYSSGRRLMTVHISARIAWHDDGWNGRICQNPAANTFCVGTQSYPGQHIGEKRSLEWEVEVKGRPCKELDRTPPCCYSHNAFGLNSAPAEAAPPVWFNDGTCNRRWVLPPATVCVWPYEVMYGDDVKSGGRFDYNQRLANARAFFGAIKPDRSLIFYYANYSNPFSEDEAKRYVLTGLSRVKAVGEELLRGLLDSVKERYGGGFVWQRTHNFALPERGATGAVSSLPRPNPISWSASHSSRKIQDSASMQPGTLPTMMLLPGRELPPGGE